jgi:hypothetical protein
LCRFWLIISSSLLQQGWHLQLLLLLLLLLALKLEQPFQK